MARRPRNDLAVARQIEMLKLAEKTGSVMRAAYQLGDKNEKLVEETALYATRVASDLMEAGTYVSYNDACRVAAERLEATRGAA